VGGLEKRTTSQYLADTFSKFGKIHDVRIRSSAADCFAFVEFEERSAAEKAVSEMDQTFVRNHRVKVAWAEFKGKNRDGRRVQRGGRNRRDDFGGGGYRSRYRSRERYDDRHYSSRYRRSPSPRYRRRSPPRRHYRRSRSRSPRPRESTIPKGDYQIQINGLRFGMSWMDLKQLGRKYGNVTFARTWEGKDSYCGLLEFIYKDEMQEAIDDLCETKMDGNRLTAFRIEK